MCVVGGGQVGFMGTSKPVQVVRTSEVGRVTTLPCALLDIWPWRTSLRWVWPPVGKILAERCRDCMNFSHAVIAAQQLGFMRACQGGGNLCVRAGLAGNWATPEEESSRT